MSNVINIMIMNQNDHEMAYRTWKAPQNNTIVHHRGALCSLLFAGNYSIIDIYTFSCSFCRFNVL